jgi:glycosyltransferase involved in cell wall biosynthesis
MKISVILPCKNEEQTILSCIQKINLGLKGKDYEIIVSDSSKDNSAKIAQTTNAKVIKHNLDGYGNAILQGIAHAKGEYIIIGDADNTYDFTQIPLFIEQLEKGYDLVIGSRIKGKIQARAMPFSHRHIGTPLLNILAFIFFKKKLSDINSGFRAIKKESLKKLDLKTAGMEFASEMIIKAIKHNLKIKEIPINYFRRNGVSKLKPINDGYRHIRFMLLYSPNFVFLIPGMFLILSGLLIMILILLKKFILFNITFQTHPMFIGSILTILGYQLILTGICARVYSHDHLKENDKAIEKLYSYLNLEKAIIAGIALLLMGFFIYLNILLVWISNDFGELNTINISIFALTFIVLGIQTFFGGFFLSILGIKER